MAEWLPPQAPGAQPAPQFEPARAEPEPEPETRDTEPAAPAAVAGGWAAPPRQGPYVRPAAEPGNGLAVTALVLGIIGVTLLLISLGLAFIFTLPCSIAAWVCGAQARNRIAAGQTSVGKGQAQAGYILGVIGVILGVMAMVGWIAAIASGLDLEQLRRDLEQQSDPDAVRALRAAAASLISAPRL